MSEMLSKKEYPLVIEHYCDSEGPAVFYAKGHTHDLADFAAAVVHAAADVDVEDVPRFDASEIGYRWCRKRPSLPHECEFDFWVEDANPGERGAFPMMEVHI